MSARHWKPRLPKNKELVSDIITIVVYPPISTPQRQVPGVGHLPLGINELNYFITFLPFMM